MIIGIDLGTTNCALAWADLQEETPERTLPIHPFPIPQLTYPGTVEPRATLPSFIYFPGPHELPAGSLALPWNEEATEVVGWLAREQGAKIPHRVVTSAKSWLSNEQVERRDPILPWQAPAEVEHISPIAASERYLSYLAQAWNYTNPQIPFEVQELVITVPASFDTIARELTVQAAQEAGFKNFTLLEEPQAAFYAWLDQAQSDWRQQVQVGDRILVCDVGGGTTDFSLISVKDSGGDLLLEREAVGEHILLGGDNMDLTLALFIQHKLKSERQIKLDNWQLQVLTNSCRAAKEQLLQEDGLEDWTLTIPGRGSSLIASSISATLTQEEAWEILGDGFFPLCKLSEQATRARQSGLRELGLPFESNPAITKHLARFLSLHRDPQGDLPFLPPTAILFNGGVFKAPKLRQRLISTLNAWLAEYKLPPVKELAGADYDLAVARGAVRSALTKHGLGVRIKGGVNRSYYLGIESSRPAIPGLPAPLKALCVAPFAMEEGSSSPIPERTFGLVVGEPVEFRFLASTCRQRDQIGDLIEDWDDEIEELQSLQVTLPASAGEEGKIIPVTLESHVTEVGTLEVWCCQNGKPQWRLEFEVRHPSPSL